MKQTDLLLQQYFAIDLISIYQSVTFFDKKKASSPSQLFTYLDEERNIWAKWFKH